MKGIVFPKVLDDTVIEQQWAPRVIEIVKNAVGKKAIDLTSEEKAAIALLSGMTPKVVDDHIIGSVRVGPEHAFEVVDGKDGK